MKIGRHLFVGMAAAVVSLAGTNVPAEQQKSKEPIKIARHDWSGNLVTTGIAKAILEEAGYNVELLQAEYMGMWPGLESGDIHLAVEIWSTSAGELMEASVATGQTENLGEIGLTGLDRWWYPKYVQESCPGLPDWQALNDCAELFSTPLTAPKGRLLLFPAAWGGFDDERVEALKLNYEIVRAGSEAALYAEVQSAIRRDAPILAWFYEPHWAPQRFDGDWIDLPPYSDACYDDPSWGSNPDMAYDCAKPSGPIWKVAWSGLKQSWPDAHTIISEMELNNAEIGDMIGAVDLDGRDADDVVAEWIAANEDRWRAWLP
ncbi:ABC transporter substrate-binding protein [Ruegeria atlantica]|uniref:ABC transporter substrate-binding protein n=1 Tax=Ruegeria atlantica TaxID=81569 RepID=UPI0020C2F8FE|nr:ABC transporter substrate-binding protein [Ruegeria atlantica]